jgi:drug/metabolite transporter (DMT)-like permease
MWSRTLELGRLASRHPTATALVGALSIAFSAIFFRYAEVSPETGAFFRCLFALPALWLLAGWEDRRLGSRPRAARAWAWLAGGFLAFDLVFWHHAIGAVGAGLSTVLANTQVVLVGLVAWVVLHERPAATSLAAIPLASVGVLLISGVLEAGAYGDDPLLGATLGLAAGVTYTGFLLALRHGASDLRRVAGPLYDATLATAVVVLGIGLVRAELDLVPHASGVAWLLLLAFTNQVAAWLLITLSLPRLPAVVTSIILTIQPVASVVLAAALLAERPSALQLAGTVAILVGVVVASIGRGRAGSRTEQPAGAA